MKVTIITIISFSFLFSCSTTKEASIHGLEIVEAEFKHWSEAPLVESDVRERGTDLELLVKNWPDGATPAHIIFRNKRSFAAEITDTTETGVQIKARIIRSSSVMSETSETVDKSDRIVFILAEGKSRYMEIEEWNREE